MVSVRWLDELKKGIDTVVLTQQYLCRSEAGQALAFPVFIYIIAPKYLNLTSLPLQHFPLKALNL